MVHEQVVEDKELVAGNVHLVRLVVCSHDEKAQLNISAFSFYFWLAKDYILQNDKLARYVKMEELDKSFCYV